MSKEALNEMLLDGKQKYDAFKAQKLKLDMSRGKPCPEQLSLSNGLITCLKEDEYMTSGGIDCRNYGGLEGIPEARELFSKIIDADPAVTMISGNSSLNVMFDMVSMAMTHGVYGSDLPWGKLAKVKFLCPSPGYDRHFSICEFFGIEMITVAMEQDGPDMTRIEALVAQDESIKGIWCVPKYSNPDGITYSDTVVDRFASMKTKAKDFRIFWDNAYAIHHLTKNGDQLKNILKACEKAGNPDRVFVFGSTSKVSFSGAGISMVAASKNNFDRIKKQVFPQTIGPDKLNQLRHVKFYKNIENIQQHMLLQAEIIKPKFDKVLDIFDTQLADKYIAWWNKPNGGYFISLNIMEGCAKRVVGMALDAGVVLTPAGATYPYKNDPMDRNIRIAPTFPSLEELEMAIHLLCICVEIASIEKLLLDLN